MSLENVDVVLSSLEGWNRGDVDMWLGDPDVDTEFRTSGIYPGTERLYRGHGELRRFWTTFREPWESLHIRVDQVREVGNVVVVLGTFEGHARDGMTVEREAAWDWRFVDDRSIRVKAHATWKEALAAVNVMKKGPRR